MKLCFAPNEVIPPIGCRARSHSTNFFSGSARRCASEKGGPFAGAIIGVLLLAVLGLMIVCHRVIRLDRFVGQA